MTSTAFQNVSPSDDWFVPFKAERECEIKLRGVTWPDVVQAFDVAGRDKVKSKSKLKLYFDTLDLKLNERGIGIRSKYKMKKGVYQHQIKIPFVASDSDKQIADYIEVNWLSSDSRPDYTKIPKSCIDAIADDSMRKTVIETLSWLQKNVTPDALRPVLSIETQRNTFRRKEGGNDIEYAHASGVIRTVLGQKISIETFEMEVKGGSNQGLLRAFKGAHQNLRVGHVVTESVAQPGFDAIREHQRGKPAQPSDMPEIDPRGIAWVSGLKIKPNNDLGVELRAA